MPTLDKTQETQTETPKNKRGRPPKGEQRGIENSSRFFEVLKKIPAHAWSEGKALVKVYRQEPCVDRTASGKPKHIQEYYEPIEGEERIKVDHGSGKYLLFLNYQGPKDSGVHEIERTNIDILDMKFPPKVPRGDWLDEPKNQGWLWAFPKEAPPPAVSPVSQLAETLDVLDGIQDRAAARARPAEAPKPPEQPSMLEIIRTVKEIMPPPVPPATDNKMLDTIVALMNGQLDRMSRDNSELRKEIAEARKNPEPHKSTLGTLKELLAEAKELDILPEGGLKTLFKSAEGALQTVTRSRMTGSEEFWLGILGKAFDTIGPAATPLLQNWLVQRARQQQPQQPAGAPALPQSQPQPPNGAAAPTNGAPAPATAAPPEFPFDPGQVQNFFRTFGPALVEWFKNSKGTGADFAEWIYDGYAADWQGLKWLHLKQAVGADQTLNVFKTSPFWPEIAAAESQFTEFLKSFCEWQPEASQAVVDLEEEEVQQ